MTMYSALYFSRKADSFVWLRGYVHMWLYDFNSRHDIVETRQ